MPIKARVDMLTTGVRTPIGIKIMGADLRRFRNSESILKWFLKRYQDRRVFLLNGQPEATLSTLPSNAQNWPRYGLTVDQVNNVVMSAIGGENVTTTIEGRERYPVNVRYFREFRDDLEKLKRVLVSVPTGGASTGGMTRMAGAVKAGGPLPCRFPLGNWRTSLL